MFLIFACELTFMSKQEMVSLGCLLSPAAGNLTETCVWVLPPRGPLMHCPAALRRSLIHSRPLYLQGSQCSKEFREEDKRKTISDVKFCVMLMLPQEVSTHSPNHLVQSLASKKALAWHVPDTISQWLTLIQIIIKKQKSIVFFKDEFDRHEISKEILQAWILRSSVGLSLIPGPSLPVTAQKEGTLHSSHSSLSRSGFLLQPI